MSLSALDSPKITQVNQQPIAFLIDKGYINNTKVVAILCDQPEVANRIMELMLRLNETIKTQEKLDNKRSWAKISTFWHAGVGVLEWRKAVNDLNTQKELVKTTAESVEATFMQNTQFLKIYSLNSEGQGSVNLIDHYLKNNILRDYLLKGNFSFV